MTVQIREIVYKLVLVPLCLPERRLNLLPKLSLFSFTLVISLKHTISTSTVSFVVCGSPLSTSCFDECHLMDTLVLEAFLVVL